MKLRSFKYLNVLLAVVFLLSACGSPTPAPTQTTGEPPIYLAIIWHQHQPVYYKDPQTGIYAKPWVRVHATKDYVDMAAMLKEYPQVKATFNLTPSLLRQVLDLEAGSKDLYWVTAEVPADQLTFEQKQFLLDRFFDTNRRIISRFPRYQELLQKRDSSQDALNAYSLQDYLDLQVLFNLAWVDPEWLEQEPLAGLVSKGRDFSEADKQTLFDEHLRLIQQVIPVHKELQDSGQIEVTMTPFAHPILPLLISTDLARMAMPDVDLGGARFAYGKDAIEHLRLGVELYTEQFGKAPAGMWPAEGSVAQEMVGMVSRAGIRWMASDEGVLARSLGMSSFTRDAKEVVTEPDKLYRPYYVQSTQGDPVAIVFRDVVISDKVGFTYSGVSGAAAAKDFLNRIHAIRQSLAASGAAGPHLVSVILDGENAWEHYENDGKEFLNSLYQGLTDDPLIKTVTPSEFLDLAPEQPSIEKLWAGSWIGADFSTWIGEEEENRAWEYLLDTRDLLQKYENGVRQTTPERLAEAQMQMYIAEGSDWFWWYGADQNSGDDEAFDRQFRDTLKGVYAALGEEPPGYLDVPIIPLHAVSADMPSTGLISPQVDGEVSAEEWEAAGVYNASGGAMAAADPFFESLAYGFDGRHLYLAVRGTRPFDTAGGASAVEVYLSAPGGGAVNNFSRGNTLLGFPANRLLVVSFDDGDVASAELMTASGNEQWGSTPEPIELAAAGESTLEVGIPLSLLGNAEVGDRISLRAIYNQEMDIAGASSRVDVHQLPGSGPAVLGVPDLGTTTIVLDVNDPERDDHGPGTYTYPGDGVYASGNFDVLNFQVGYDDENIVFKFAMRGPVDNPWGSPNGLSLQTFDIYIDKDGDGKGGGSMLPGRNVAFESGYTWDYAITIEGWEPGIFTPAEGGPERIAGAGQFFVLADPGQQKVTVRVPKSILGDNPQDWRFAAVVLSQEGYPSGGVMRVRDVAATAQQWRLGGAPANANNHTRVIDLVWPEAGEQEAWLSSFTPTSASQGDLTAENFARVPMMDVKE